MSLKRKAKRSGVLFNQAMAHSCSCRPLSSLHSTATQKYTEEGDEQIVLASRELAVQVRQALEGYFPRSTPFSLLLLHVSQWEYQQVSQQATIVPVRHRFHAPKSVLEQVLMNVRRAIRSDDLLLAHAGTGAALLFPEVDRNGMYVILERVFRNVNLLQAETLLPPLRYETDILLGVGSYPEPGPSLEHLLYHAGLPARRLTLRPAITTQLWERDEAGASTWSEDEERQKHLAAATMLPPGEREREHAEAMTSKSNMRHVPFMQLPARLSGRLKHFIPHALASELRCAPVGRDHQHLTVAMADPTDEQAISRLKETTGMTIFPVSCDEDALNELLTEKW
jgi:hypothetical protein